MSKIYIKHTLILGCIAFLAACGSQVSDTSGTAAKTNSQSSQSSAASNISDSKLLASLAATYPNGQLPAALKAQADIALAQNPAALKMVASSALIANVKAGFSNNNNIKAQAIVADTGSYSPVYRIQNNNLPGAYFFTIFYSERYAALSQNPSWKLEGAAFYTATTPAEGLSPVYRFRNKTNGSYVYTIFEEEYQSLLANYSATFVLEGVSWYARQSAAAGYTPLYRFRNKTNGTYLFSAYESEKNTIVASYSEIFEFEGISYYVNTTDTNPDCGEKLPEKTLATLPTSYSARLLDGNFGSEKVFLTNTGFVAWQTAPQCTMPPCMGFGQTGVGLYSTASDTVMMKNPLNSALNVISLNDAGVALVNESTTMMINDQFADISTLPLAKLWDGITTTDSVVRAPVGFNSRAGRHTFSLPMGGVNDGSGRKWAYPSFPSYLDGAKLVNTSSTLSLGNFPGAVNHCGTAVEHGGYTRDGLYFSRGTMYVNNIGVSFTADSDAYPRISISGLTNTGTTFGVLSDMPAKFPMLGFIRSTADQKYYLNSEVKDVNDANTGVGNKIALKTEMGITSYYATEGQIMAADGAQSLKPIVPSLATSADTLLPKVINNNGQIVVQTCTPSGYGGCLQPQKLYLLTPH